MSKPTAPEALPQWRDVASKLDPMMPSKDYEQVRTKFFMDQILPRIPRGQDRSAIFKEFKARTERTPLLSVGEHIGLRAGIAMDSNVKAFAAPLAGISDDMKKLHDTADRSLQANLKVADREGMSTGLEQVGGALVGELPATLASFMVAEPIAGAIVAKAGLKATTALRAKALVEGGLAFGALNAAKENDGSRFVAGAKGFAEGMAWAVPVLPFLRAKGLAKTEGEAKELLRKAVQEPSSVPPEVHEAIAEQTMKESKILKSQEVLPNSIVRNPKVRGITVSMIAKEGNAGLRSIEVKAGRETQALAEIRSAQVNGFEFNAIHFHPDYESKAFKFMRDARDRELWKYEDGVILEVKKGLAEQTAKQIQSELGVPTTAVSDSHVELNVKREDASLLSQLEASVSGKKADALPEGVSYLGKQPVPIAAGGKEGEFLEMYNYDLPSGGKTTFTVHPGDDINVKLAKVKEKWANFEKGEASVDPRMTLEKAEELVRSAGRDPAKSDLEAVRTLGEEEFNRLLEVTKRTKEAGSEFDPLGNWMEKVASKSKGAQASVKLEELIPAYKKQITVLERDVTRLGKELETLPLGATRTKVNLTQFDKQRQVAAWKASEALMKELEANGGALATPRMKISLHPFRASVEVPESIYQRLNPGTKAALYNNWRGALAQVGIRLPEGANEMYPAVMFTKKTRPEERYHEFIHAAIVRSGTHETFQDMISKEGRLHAFAIASHLEKAEVYSKFPFSNLVNEAYTYAATGIRYGKTEYGRDLLQWLSEINGTEEQLKWFVQETSENILQASQGKLDSVSERILQRKMVDLIRRSDQNITYGITNAGGPSARWNPESLGWNLAGEDGEITHLNTVDEVWDYLTKVDASDMAPSFSSSLEALGVRGPMAAVDIKRGLPTPVTSLPSDERWTGWSSFSGWFRPFLPWAASLDSKINKALAKRGESFPLFEAVKKVDDQVRAADPWLSSQHEALGKILRGTPDKKLQDYFSVLTYEPKHFGVAASKYNLSPKDIEKVRKLEEWMTSFRDETKIQPFEWLREMYPKVSGSTPENFTPEAMKHLGWQTAYDPKSAGFWEKAVRENDLRPGDAHIGRFANWLIGQGYEKKFVQEPLRDLSKLLEMKIKDGSGIERSFLPASLKWPLENYVRTIRGIPDQTQQAINRGMKDFVGFFQDKIKRVNKTMPLGFKIPGGEANISPRLMQRLMTLSYASALGLRPAVAVRDGLQVLSTSLPVLGVKKFTRGFELMYSKEMRDLADEAGVFISKTHLADAYAGMLGEVPIEGKISQGVHDIANIMMSPSRWGDNLARGVTFLGEYDASLKAIKKLRAGTLDQSKFMKETSLWFLDDQIASKILVEAQHPGRDAKEIAKKIALETTDLTQWPFRRGTNPSVLGTGIGRIFGQFGRWPANYADFLARMYQKSKGTDYRDKALTAAGTWLATNYAASKGMEALGVDASTWFFVSPTGYSSSAHLELLQNIVKSPEESDAGRQARKDALNYWTNFIPARVEMENIYKSLNEAGPQTGIMDPALLRVLGFRPKKAEAEIAPEDLLQFEMGFGKK